MRSAQRACAVVERDGSRVSSGLRSDVRDVQERWFDAREEWDAY